MKLRNPFLSLCPIFLQNYQRCLSTTCPRGPWGKINLVGLQLPSLFPFIYLYFNPFHRLVGWLFDFSFKLWLCSDICRREGVGNKQKNNFRKLLHTFKGLKILNRTTFCKRLVVIIGLNWSGKNASFNLWVFISLFINRVLLISIRMSMFGNFFLKLTKIISFNHFLFRIETNLQHL